MRNVLLGTVVLLAGWIVVEIALARELDPDPDDGDRAEIIPLQFCGAVA